MTTFTDRWRQLNWDDIALRINSKTPVDVERALNARHLTRDDLMALLSPAASAYLESMAQRAQRLTRQRFGNTVSFYVPLYLSNLCANDCTYCGFSMSNRIKRKTLNEEEIARECAAIREMGFEHLLLVTGEHQGKVGMDYFRQHLPAIRRQFASLQMEVQPLSQDEYAELKTLGLDGVMVYQETYHEATYARLKGNGDIVNVTYDVHLGELRTPEDVTGAADLKAGDYVGVSAELKGTWATREEFVAACRPVIEAVRATGVRDPYISLYMRESRDTETPLYSLTVEGSYQADMTAEQLAQCVTERIYVDDAGYYMDAEELAGWQSEQSSAARDAELEALEAEWQARLDEAEAAAEQARAEAEERVAQVQAEADERVAQAQADADSRVAEAQANAAA